MHVRHTLFALAFTLGLTASAAAVAQDAGDTPAADSADAADDTAEPATDDDRTVAEPPTAPDDIEPVEEDAADQGEFAKPLIADRAGAADSPYTVGALVFVVEAGLDWARNGEGDAGIYDGIRAPLALRFGVHDYAELHVISDGFAWDRRIVDGVSLGSTTGGSDVRFGGKVEFPGLTDSGPGTGLVLSLVTPTGTDDVTGDIWAIFTTLAFDQPLPAGFAIGLNLGATIPVTDRDDSPDLARYVLALGWTAAPIDERLGIFIEFFGDSTLSSDSETALYFNGGFTWAISDVLAVDLAARAGLTDTAPDVGIASGFAFRL